MGTQEIDSRTKDEAFALLGPKGEPVMQRHADHEASFYLVGGGIASLATAAFLIRDGNVRGHKISVLEASANPGGSLDAAGTASTGYRMRGGRMLESKYVCTFDLFSSIPTLDGSQTVTEETFAWNRIMKTASKSRLFRKGAPVDAPAFGLDEEHIVTLERLIVEPEGMLGRSSIRDHFSPDFFVTDFWFMWCSTFAFQPWHSAVEFKRYLARFTHMISGFNTLTGIMRTVYNQYDSMVRPLHRWLEERGVQFIFDTRVTELSLDHGANGYAVKRLLVDRGIAPEWLEVGSKDFVIVTLGSMTAVSSLGSMEQAPMLSSGLEAADWILWRSLAAGQADCGHPDNFTDHVAESNWVSFTVTLHESTFFDRVRDLTGNAPGEGGLISFPDSGWFLSIVLPYQPHFLDQPEDVQVFWGYGLTMDRPGDFVKKSMPICSGREILTEILGHLQMQVDAEKVLGSSVCIPCMMPYITSQFLRRSKGDRPLVVPERSKNLAFVGQFCEQPDDVVFTIEYSIRSAQTAVYTLLGLDRKPPPVYKGQHRPRVLLDAYRALHTTRL